MDYDNHGLAYDQQLEENTLGCLLLQPERIKDIIAQTNLKVESFFFERNQTVFKTIIELWEKDKPPNQTLVSSQLNGAVPKNYIYELAEKVTNTTSTTHFAERLVELERWRARRTAALNALEATGERDLEKFSKAKASLDNDEIYINSISAPDDLGKQFQTFIKGEKVEAFPLPYKQFNERMAGGLRRKQMSLLGGWSSHGKSVVIDEWLEYIAKQGKRCHLYINEMGIEDRVARSIARKTNIPYNDLLQHRLGPDDKVLIDDAISDGCPYFSITECAGWSIHELAYDIKSRSFDVIGVDILHLFDYDSEIELARISRLLNRTAKQANCHIIATVHLNEYRVNDVIRPRPVLRDIRGSGMLKNDADNVIFIYREQDPTTSNPTNVASIYTAKVRNGQMGVVPLMFKERNFSFEEIE